MDEHPQPHQSSGGFYKSQSGDGRYKYNYSRQSRKVHGGHDGGSFSGSSFHQRGRKIFSKTYVKRRSFKSPTSSSQFGGERDRRESLGFEYPCKRTKINGDFKTPEQSLLSPESPPQLNSEGAPVGKKTGSEVVPIIPQSPVSHRCRLCACSPLFRSEDDFLVHLTIIHYREKLMKRVQIPYKCIKCDYTPAVVDDAEDLLMHYGCEERFALQYYEQELKDLIVEEEDTRMEDPKNVVADGVRITITCELCNSCFDNERLFVRHISLRHFTKALCDELPIKMPFTCPFIDCNKEKTNLHALMLHYGCEHNISMDLYLKKHGGSKDSIRIVTDEPPKEPIKAIELPSPQIPINQETKTSPQNKKPSSSLKCRKCPKKPGFASQMSLNYHLMVTHFFPDLPKVGPYSCPKCLDNYPEKIPFTKHFLQVHLKEYIEKDPEFRKRKIDQEPSSSSDEKPLKVMTTTHHRKSEARRKITQRWEKTSVDVQSKRIEDLELQILKLKEEYKDALKKKSSDFEKWIVQKEKLLEQEVENLKNVEEDLERSNLDVIELQKQLEQVRSSQKTSEDMLVEKHNLNHSLMKEKKILEKKVINLTNETDESKALYADLEMSLKDLKIQFDSRGKEINDLKSCLTEKEEEIKDLISEHEKKIFNLQKSVAKSEKTVEGFKQKLKQANDDKKAKTAQIKENTKKFKESESNLKDQISKLTKANKKLDLGLNQVKSELEKNAKSEIRKLEKDQSKFGKQIEEYQNQLKVSSEIIETLESEKSTLTNSLDKVQKVIRDYEIVLQDKNEKLSENKSRNEELESQIKDFSNFSSEKRVLEKQNRDLNRSLKELKAGLNDWEERYHKCSNSLSEMTKEKSILNGKLQNSDENVSNLEEEIAQIQNLLSQKKNEANNLKSKLDLSDTSNAKLSALVNSRNDEISTLQNKLQEMDCKIKLYEKEIRGKLSLVGGGGAEENPYLRIQNLESQLANKDMELHHLKVNLNQLKTTSIQDLRSENSALKSQLSRFKSSNEKFEVEFSKKIAELEMMKDTAQDLPEVLSNKGETPMAIRKSNNNIQEVGNSIKSSSLDNRNEMVDKLVNVIDSQEETIEKSGKNLTVKVKEEPSDAPIPLVNASNPSIVMKVADIKKEDNGVGPISPYNSDFEEFNFNVEDEDGLADVIFPQSSSSSLPSNLTIFNPISTPNLPSLSHSALPSLTISKKQSGLEDVTGKFDESEDDVVCGICLQYDPPLPNDAPRCETYKTEWVGCDCDQWYHKICTKLSKFSTRFSCKSVKKKCLKK